MAAQSFFGRERELARLMAFLDRALNDNGLVTFVCGEAGSGKTALVNAFLDQAQTAHDDLLTAVGTCNAQSGIGDPYLPFREILAALSGIREEHRELGAPDVHPSHQLQNAAIKAAKVLVEVGPDLVGAIIPGAALFARVGKAVAQKAAGLDELEQMVKQNRERALSGSTMIDQARIFEQYANVLNALAAEQPLLIVLDDLQWADEASISLLFHLSRRIRMSRILIIGTYRSDEVLLPRGTDRHPLGKVLAEIKRYTGDVWVDLDQANASDGRAFVDQILDSEPNRLDAAFRDILYRHTGGQPLFTVELLRTLQERGDMTHDAQGHWVVSAALDWSALPARVEGVIEERVGRLDRDEREDLNVASVAGEAFLAEVIARVQQAPLRQMLQTLAQELSRRHHLVQEEGLVTVGAQRLASYKFVHALFQQYIYRALSVGERQLLHGEVARTLEALYAGHTEQACVQLAWHYDQAGEGEKAARYLVLAGQQALQHGTLPDARRSFERALELLPPQERPLRWEALVGEYETMPPTDERGITLTALLEASRELGDPDRLALAYLKQASYLRLVPVANRQAIAACEAGLAAARQARNRTTEAYLLCTKMHTLGVLGDVTGCGTARAEALACIQDMTDEVAIADVYMNLTSYYSYIGDWSEAIHVIEQAIEKAHALDLWLREAILLRDLSQSYSYLGAPSQSRAAAERAVQLAEKIGASAIRPDFLMRKLAAETLCKDWIAASQSAARLRDMGRVHDGTPQLALELANALERMGDRVGATDYFAMSLKGAQNTDADESLRYEAVSGLARCAAAGGQIEQARGYADEVWEHLSRPDPTPMNLSVYLTCTKIFAQAGDTERARAAAEAGYAKLTADAAKISDPQWRRSFLENVPENQAIAELWSQLSH